MAEAPATSATPLRGGRVAALTVVGAGKPLLWIEGGPGYPARLGLPDCELLAHRFRCHLVDAPGGGGSTPPPAREGYQLTAMVEFYDAVREALGLRRWTVMGHSWGGLVGLAYAATFPAAVERLIVVDGYAGDASVCPEDADHEREQAWARHEDATWFAEAMADGPELTEETTAADLMAAHWPLYPLYFAYPERRVQAAHIARLREEGTLNPDAMRAWYLDGYAAEVDLTPRLGSIKCPTLVLVGAHDWVCGPVWNKHIAAHVAGAEYYVFEESGH